MFRIRFNNSVFVSLSSKTVYQYSEQEWVGDPSSIASLRSRLKRAIGAHGHALGDRTTPIDLYLAIKKNLSGYDPVIVKGENMVVRYKPMLPPGAIT